MKGSPEIWVSTGSSAFKKLGDAGLATAVVVHTEQPSAFDVAMDEARQEDAAVWAKFERDLKP